MRIPQKWGYMKTCLYLQVYNENPTEVGVHGGGYHIYIYCIILNFDTNRKEKQKECIAPVDVVVLEANFHRFAAAQAAQQEAAGGAKKATDWKRVKSLVSLGFTGNENKIQQQPPSHYRNL